GARRPRQHAAGAAEARGGGRARELAARAPDAREGCAGAGAATAAPSRAHTAASAAAARGDGGAGRCAPRGGAVRAHTRGRPEGARLAPAAAGPRGLALGRPGARQAAGERARAALARAGRRAAGARAAAHEGRPGGPGHAPRGAGLGHGRLRTRRMHARGPLATPAGPRVPRESARARRSGRGPARPPPGARGGASARSCGAAAPRRACLRPPCRRWWCHVGAAGEAPAAKPGAPTGSPRCSWEVHGRGAGPVMGVVANSTQVPARWLAFARAGCPRGPACVAGARPPRVDGPAGLAQRVSSARPPQFPHAAASRNFGRVRSDRHAVVGATGGSAHFGPVSPMPKYSSVGHLLSGWFVCLMNLFLSTGLRAQVFSEALWAPRALSAASHELRAGHSVGRGRGPWRTIPRVPGGLERVS
ncbi:unnamed protein product, partial [Prorocentrum cordatum]